MQIQAPLLIIKGTKMFIKNKEIMSESRACTTKPLNFASKLWCISTLQRFQ